MRIKIPNWAPGWLIAAGAIAILSIALAIAAAVLKSKGADRLNRELIALRASGAPEYPEQIPQAPLEGKDPTEWLAPFSEILTEVKIPFARLPACAAEAQLESGDSEWWDALDAALRDPVLSTSLSACQKEALQRRSELQHSDLERALEVHRYSKFDWQGEYANPKREESKLFPLPNMSAYSSAVEVLCDGARQAASDGNVAETTNRLLAALELANFLEDAPDLLGHLCWQLGIGTILEHGVVTALHQLPDGSDLGQVDSRISGILATRQLQKALIGERAFVNSIYRDMRAGNAKLDSSVMRALPAGRWANMFLENDQADYLQRFSRAIQISEHDWWDGAWDELDLDSNPDTSPSHFFSPITAMVFPQVRSAGGSAASLQAKILLVRAAILARRDGATAAQAWLAAQIDPCDGNPLRSRVEPNGVLTMWSVGADGVDDQAIPPEITGGKRLEKDEAIRIRAR